MITIFSKESGNVISNMERDINNFQMAAYIMASMLTEGLKALADIAGLMVKATKVSG